MTMCNTKSVILGVVGFALVIIGSTLCFLWPLIFETIIEQELPLSPTSRGFELWKDSSEIPVSMEFYFFNWTNPEELKVDGKKPVLVQLGPYTFTEKRQKVNITFHPENDTVSYMQKRTWHFDPNKTNGSLSDKVTHLNVVAVSAARKIRYWSSLFHQSLNYLLSGKTVHVTKTVDELLFTGYKDQIIDMGNLAPVGTDIPPYDKFGWFYLRNNSAAFDGIVNMATGKNDISSLGVVKNWNYQDTTKYYKSPCNVVEGGAGEFFPPNRTKDDITLFTPDMCRPLIYEYSKTVMHQGLVGYQYELGAKTLSNETYRRYPHEQAKYFEPTTTTESFFTAEPATVGLPVPTGDPDLVNMGQCFCNGECSPSGLMNVTACRYGAPGFISLPHFHKADPMLRNQVEGLNPNPEDHSFYITLEPTTGVPIDVAARLQVNILLEPSHTLQLFNGVPRIYFPILWFNLRSGTTDELALSLRQLLDLPTVGFYASVVIALVGAVLLVFVASLTFIRQQKRSSANDNGGKVYAFDVTTKDKKTEAVYMDVTSKDDDKNTRTDRQLYPKL